jgi:hypothetical protein
MKLRIPQATAMGYIEVPPRGIFDFSYPDSLYRRGRVQGGGKICPGLMAGGGELMVYENVYEIIRSDTNKKR